MTFSNSALATGIVEQARSLMRVDSTQWPTSRIVNSANNWLDFITGYALMLDKRFRWDDTNHTKLPVGTAELTINVKDYSFLTDEQGNRILTLLRIDVLDSNGTWHQLQPIDQEEIPQALDEFEKVAGTPKFYQKLSDNVVRLYPKPAATISAGIKFYFQRTGSYFAATDTTKEPGVAIPLHRGFVIASAYDGALTLGLANLQALSVEREKEEQKVVRYFADRNRDQKSNMRPNVENCR